MMMLLSRSYMFIVVFENAHHIKTSLGMPSLRLEMFSQQLIAERFVDRGFMNFVQFGSMQVVMLRFRKLLVLLFAHTELSSTVMFIR